MFAQPNTKVSLRKVIRSRLGYRDGFLFLAARGNTYRIQGWPTLSVEVRLSDGEWMATSKDIRETFLPAFHSVLNYSPCPAIFPRGSRSWWKRVSQNLPIPTSCNPQQRRLIFAWLHWYRFCTSLPSSISEAIHSVACDPISALELFTRVPRAIDLVAHDRLLASALARHWEFPAVGKLDWDGVAKVVELPRREIVGWLGFEGKDSVVKGLRRAGIDGLRTAKPLIQALQVLSDENLRARLAHHDPIPGILFELYSTERIFEWLDPNLLNRPKAFLAKIGYFSTLHELYLQNWLYVNGARTLSKADPEKLKLDRFIGLFPDRLFPEGPTPNNPNIRQLRSVQELLVEGREMENCVGQLEFAASIMLGHRLLYRVEKPLRALMELSGNSRIGFQFGEIRGPRNVILGREHIEQIKEAFPEIPRTSLPGSFVPNFHPDLMNG